MYASLRRLIAHARFSPQLLQNLPPRFKQWTECQELTFAIPREKNVMIQSFTGSGKTVAYLLPAIQDLMDSGGTAVVAVPTRELARQIDSVSSSLVSGSEVQSKHICAGTALSNQGSENGPHMIVGTPGALINNINLINPQHVKTIIIDEVDRLLDFGFISQLEIVLNVLGRNKPRIVVVSATFSKEIELICRRLLGPGFVKVESSCTAPPALSHEILTYEPLDFLPTLGQLLLGSGNAVDKQSLVIFPTTRALMFFYSRFKTGLDAGELLSRPMNALHGRMVDAKRRTVSEKILRENNGILFSTDIVARGLDFPNLGLVCQVGFSGVDDPVAQFVHRSGRTARAGNEGKNIVLVGKGIDDKSKWLSDAMKLARIEETGAVKIESDDSFFKHEPTAYHKLLSTKCLESLLSWFVERRAMLGLKGEVCPVPQGSELERKARLVKALTDMVRSAGVPEPMISSKLAKKLRIDDIPGIHLSSFR